MGFREIRAKILAAEGYVDLEDLEFFHTHLERGKVFSFYDMGTRSKHEESIRRHIDLSSDFTSYAIPIKVTVFFAILPVIRRFHIKLNSFYTETKDFILVTYNL